MTTHNPHRRRFLQTAGLAAGGVSVARATAAALSGAPEAILQNSPHTAPPLSPSSGHPYNPVVTLNGWTLPWVMKGKFKEFHLVAQPVVREMAPGLKAHLWGYNGQSPGPTIEVVAGDWVRIFVTNQLPEYTSVHWHGQRLPCGMDGVTGLTQPPIPPGQTFVYEFEAKRPGTFMYHPHADEMVQMAMGMMGFWVTHPREPHPHIAQVERDFCFLLSSYNIDPGRYTPQVMTMLDFNLWAWNSRVFPGIDPLVVGLGDRVRIRVGNLTMTNHPIHLHGHEFEVTGTDGGPVPPGARWPEVTTDVAVGQMRQLEFVADAPGDWAIHCHKSHHTMNAMGHNVPTMLGVEQADVVSRIRDLIPDYMAMGGQGMAEMAHMDMPLPENAIPMMAGQGPFGPLGMGGMFSVLKVRRNQKPLDYKDPGWFTHPPGSVAKPLASQTSLPPAPQKPTPNIPGAKEVFIRKPPGHRGH